MNIDLIQVAWLFLSVLLGIWTMGLVVAALFVEDNVKQRYLFLALAVIIYYVSLIVAKGA